ncbi:unnamed protein product [Calypogeia fissa]
MGRVGSEFPLVLVILGFMAWKQRPQGAWRQQPGVRDVGVPSHPKYVAPHKMGYGPGRVEYMILGEVLPPPPPLRPRVVLSRVDDSNFTRRWDWNGYGGME